MTKQELRLELLKLVWPMQTGRETADPRHYIDKATQLEKWCNEGAGQLPSAAPGSRPVGNRK